MQWSITTKIHVVDISSAMYQQSGGHGTRKPFREEKTPIIQCLKTKTFIIILLANVISVKVIHRSIWIHRQMKQTLPTAIMSRYPNKSKQTNR